MSDLGNVENQLRVAGELYKKLYEQAKGDKELQSAIFEVAARRLTEIEQNVAQQSSTAPQPISKPITFSYSSLRSSAIKKMKGVSEQMTALSKLPRGKISHKMVEIYNKLVKAADTFFNKNGTLTSSAIIPLLQGIIAQIEDDSGNHLTVLKEKLATVNASIDNTKKTIEAQQKEIQKIDQNKLKSENAEKCQTLKNIENALNDPKLSTKQRDFATQKKKQLINEIEKSLKPIKKLEELQTELKNLEAKKQDTTAQVTWLSALKTVQDESEKALQIFQQMAQLPPPSESGSKTISVVEKIIPSSSPSSPSTATTASNPPSRSSSSSSSSSSRFSTPSTPILQQETTTVRNEYARFDAAMRRNTPLEKDHEDYWLYKYAEARKFTDQEIDAGRRDLANNFGLRAPSDYTVITSLANNEMTRNRLLTVEAIEAAIKTFKKR